MANKTARAQASRMEWKPVPGRPRDLEAVSGDRRFLVHVGHGELWYAQEYRPDGSFFAGCAYPFDGPTARQDAITACERAAAQPARKGRWSPNAK